MKKHRQNFINETSELMSTIEQSLMALEKDKENIEILNSIYRSVHSLKGIAGMFDFNDIGKLSHELENVFSSILKKTLTVNDEIVDLSLRYIDFVKISIAEQHSESVLKELRDEIEERIGTLLHTKNDENLEENGIKTYHILLAPSADFEDRAINLSVVFDLLEENNEFEKFEKPTLPGQVDKKFYMFWEYIVVTSKSAEVLTDGILLADDELIVTPIADFDVLNSSKAEQLKTKIKDSTELTDIEQLHSMFFGGQTKKSTKEPQKKKGRTKEDIFNAVSEYQITGINVGSGKLDNLMNFVSELISNQEAINIFAQKIQNEQLKEMVEALEKTTTNIKDTSLSMRLIPLDSIMIKFRRLVRDLSKLQNKTIVFETDGTQTQLDKTVISMLVEPLMHILRNCIDHGIESPKERVEANKSATGRIKLSASQEGNEVIIQVHDDGRGIDPEMIRQNAVEKGLIEPNKKLSKKEHLDILFMPGFTTAKEVSEISGRGVGMDVVKKKITDIRGEIHIDSEPGLGTYVTLKLPLTLSIIETLLVSINNQRYLIPQSSITNVDSISHEELFKNKKKLIELRGNTMSLVDLTKKFDGNADSTNTGNKKIISVKYKNKHVGLVIDKIIGEHQAVLKPLGALLGGTDSFSGGGILGDGTPVLMISPNTMLNSMFLEKEQM